MRKTRWGLLALAGVALGMGVPMWHTALVPAADAAAPSVAAEKAALYVATNGNDKWSGQLPEPNQAGSDGPFANIARARDAVRKMKGGPAGTVTVLIRGGVYTLTDPLVFGGQDSGSTQSPVVYAAYPGETPVISGGRPVTGWIAGPNGTWTAQVAGANFHQLFVNGQRRVRSRLPKSGYYMVQGQMSDDANARFRFRSGEIRPEWAGDAEVVALDKWIDFRGRIMSVNGDTVTVEGRKHPQVNTATRYWVENIPEGLEAPGTWYLRRRDGTVYYHPMPGEEPGGVQATASNLQQVIRIEGAHDITFRGLTISHADRDLSHEGRPHIQADAEISSAVEASGTRNISIEHCAFSHLGQYALGFGKGSKSNHIVGNEFSDLGGGAIKIGDAHSDVHPQRPPNFGAGRGRPVGPMTFSTNPNDYRAAPEYPRNDGETSSQNVISDNRIHDLGLVFPGTVAVWIGQSYGNTVAHNEIYNTPYSGISVGWSWGFGPSAAHDNIIEYNHVHDVGRGIMSDMAAIYALGIQPGTIIRNNLLHDVTRYDGEGGYGGWGIYLDATSSQITVENNIIYGNEDGALCQNFGERNTIVNNIFALNHNAAVQRSHGAPEPSLVLEHNIVLQKSGDFIRMNAAEGTFQFDYNLYYYPGGAMRMGGRGIPEESFEDWRGHGQDKHSIVANPRFADAEHGNFALPADSPAFQIGFKAIDLSTVGPRTPR